jgi:hypothetical protein
MRAYLQKTLSQKRAGEWLKVKALSSNPSNTKKEGASWFNEWGNQLSNY